MTRKVIKKKKKCRKTLIEEIVKDTIICFPRCLCFIKPEDFMACTFACGVERIVQKRLSKT